jgi:exosortase B
MSDLAKPAFGAGFPRLKGLAPEGLPLLIGLLAMFVPTFYDLFRGSWSSPEQAHGPMILALSLWLAGRRWKEVAALRPPVRSAGGWLICALSLMLYIVGRSQQIVSFEIAAFILILAAIVLIARGAPALRLLWFPFFFMLFAIPLPASVVSALTMPMKMAVSYVTEQLLFMAGLPVARSGVILQIGQYQLLVADACAGLQTLLTLESLGLFYLNVVRHPSALRNIGLAILIVPISFAANVIRVCTLTLITYYFGDAAGRGFLHGFAGMVLFISALLLIISVDSFLQFVARKRAPARSHA